MNNLGKLLSGELERMRKYNILTVSFLVALIWIGIAYFVGLEDIDSMIPLLIFIDATSMSMLMIGATIFYEKQEGTINTLFVSPISKSEYILAKSFANITSNIITLVLIYGYAKIFKEVNLNFLGLLGAVFLIAIFHSLIGFILTFKTKDFTDMLMGMMKYIFIFTLPVLLERMGLIKNKLLAKILYILPTKASAVLLESTAGRAETKEMWFSILYLALGSVILFFIVRKKFEDFAMGKAGE